MSSSGDAVSAATAVAAAASSSSCHAAVPTPSPCAAASQCTPAPLPPTLACVAPALRTHQPRVVLLTGGAGFIGGAVALHLVRAYPDVRVINFDKLDYCSSLYRLRALDSAANYKFIKGDILSTDLVSHVLHSERVDTIFHFAAQSHVDNSFGNSLSFTRNNVLGTHTLLEAARRYQEAGVRADAAAPPPLRRFIHVSTDEVYGESTSTNDDGDVALSHEQHTVLEPTNPYAASKAGAEFLVKAYHRSFGLPVVITRGNNVYGPGQFPEKVIPKFISLLERHQACCIHGDGTHVRNYVYIDDAVRAFDIVLHRAVVGEVYNIGTEFELSNIVLARRLVRLFGHDNRDDDDVGSDAHTARPREQRRENTMLRFVDDRKFNDRRYAIHTGRLAEFGWRNEVDFDTGLRRTVDWYRTHGADCFPYAEAFLSPHPKVELHADEL